LLTFGKSFNFHAYDALLGVLYKTGV